MQNTQYINKMRTQLFHYLTLFLILLLSGCATQSQLNNRYPVENLKNINPQYASVQQGHLEYYRFGQGSPIVLITGYVTDISSWDKRFLATLAEEHQVIVFNNRNVGGSSIPSDHYDSKDLATDTYQLIQELHLKKPAVLGISMGGMIAQHYAVLYPHALGSLILINTAIAGKQSVHPTAATEKTLMNMPTNKLARYAVALKLFFPENQRSQMGLALALDRFQPNHYTEIDASVVMPQQKFLIQQWTHDNDTAKKLTHLHLPVLILNGTADAVLPPENSLILANTIPNATLMRWQNGGHAMIYQYPESLAMTINRFLAQVNPTRND